MVEEKTKKAPAKKAAAPKAPAEPSDTTRIAIPRHLCQRRLSELPPRRGKNRPDPKEGISVNKSGNYVMTVATAKRLGLSAEVIASAL